MRIVYIGGKKLNQENDVELMSLYQQKRKKEQENETLEKKLGDLEKNIYKCKNGKYIIKKIEGLYHFIDNQGNIKKEYEIQNLIEDSLEKKIFEEYSREVYNYNKLYSKILKNKEEIDAINEYIKVKKKN